MDTQAITSMLAVSILVVLVPLLLLARLASRGKVSRRAWQIARELGLEYRGTLGSLQDPLFRDLFLLRREGRWTIADVMRGDYQGRDVVLASVRERPLLASTRQTGMWGVTGIVVRVVAMIVAAGFLMAMLASTMNFSPLRSWFDFWLVVVKVLALVLLGLVVALPFLAKVVKEGRSGANALLIVFVEPIDGLPGFLLEPRSATNNPSPGPGPIPPDEALGPALSREYLSLGASPDALPPAFLDRASRVLVGRSTPWTVQGVGGRLSLWIANWHAPTTLRPIRSYRSVLDDAVSLRDALERSEASDDLAGSGSGAARKSIRSALERIRGEPGPNHEPAPGLGGD